MSCSRWKSAKFTILVVWEHRLREYIVNVTVIVFLKYLANWKDLPPSRLLSTFHSVTSFNRWITPCLQQITKVSVLPRWWSWKCRGWSLWLPTGLSTAPWRWREARNFRPTKQKLPSQRKCLSMLIHAFMLFYFSLEFMWTWIIVTLHY